MITGANGHVGRRLVEGFASLNADILLTDRNETSTDILRCELALREDVTIEYIQCNLELEGDRDDLIRILRDRGDRIDVLVNCAAFVGTENLSGWNEPFAKQTLDTWRRAIEVNLTAPFHLIQGISPLMKGAVDPNIVNISSIYGQYAPDWSLYEGLDMSNPAAYAISKAGLIHLTKWLATTLAPSVRVNSVSPGGVFRGQNETFVDRYKQKVPLRRMATEHDVWAAVMYLSTSLGSYVTGQNLLVDGGWGL